MRLSRHRASSCLLVGMVLVQLSFFSSSARATSGGTGSIGLTTLGSPYGKNFDTLTNTPDGVLTAILPNGWFIDESGTSARNDGNYAVGTGSSNTGDIFSYGAAAGNSERALGALRSGTLVPILGARFVNNTGAAITQ